MKKIVGLTGVILIACMMISSLFVPVNSAENTSATSDCRVSNLPKGDALYLEKGIEIKGKENLMRALEDYCS